MLQENYPVQLNKKIRAFVIALSCLSVSAPQGLLANTSLARTADGIPVHSKVDDVALQTGGQLQGAIVDVNGKPVINAPVAIGQGGKVLAEMTTDKEGRFAVAGLKAGTYQVASFAGVQSYRLWEESQAPSMAKKGVIHVMPEGEGLERGNNSKSPGPLVRAVTNPLVLATAVGVAIAIGVAASDDDAS
jgi:hypothetical protein